MARRAGGVGVGGNRRDRGAAEPQGLGSPTRNCRNRRHASSERHPPAPVPAAVWADLCVRGGVGCQEEGRARFFGLAVSAEKKIASLCSGARLAELGQANGAHGRREPVRLGKPEPPTCLLMVRIMIAFSFLSNYGNRISKSKLLNYLSAFSISGYAIPGVILAVAFITFISWLSDTFSSAFGFASFKPLFIGSVIGLVLAYFVRFFSLSFNGIRSGYLKINQSIDDSAYLLGYSKLKTFTKIHVPYLKNSVFLVTVLIAIEIIKELPITLILRPFNFETFATKAYSYAAQDLLEAAAFPSLCLIMWASLFILFVSRYILSDK